jgi:hypothetical protein
MGDLYTEFEVETAGRCYGSGTKPKSGLLAGWPSYAS